MAESSGQHPRPVGEATRDDPTRLLFTISEVAEMTGLSRGKLYALCEAREIEHQRIGKRIVFTSAQIEAFLESTKVPALSAPATAEVIDMTPRPRRRRASRPIST